MYSLQEKLFAIYFQVASSQTCVSGQLIVYLHWNYILATPSPSPIYTPIFIHSRQHFHGKVEYTVTVMLEKIEGKWDWGRHSKRNAGWTNKMAQAESASMACALRTEKCGKVPVGRAIDRYRKTTAKHVCLSRCSNTTKLKNFLKIWQADNPHSCSNINKI